MRETEILRGLGKAKQKFAKAAAGNHFEDGVVPAEDPNARIRAYNASLAARGAVAAAPAPAPAPTPTVSPAPAAAPASGGMFGGLKGAISNRMANIMKLEGGTPFVQAPPGVPRTGDHVPAMIEHGEAVLPKQTVAKVGAGNIARLIANTNSGHAPQRGLRAGAHFADGDVPLTADTPVSTAALAAIPAGAAAGAAGVSAMMPNPPVDSTAKPPITGRGQWQTGNSSLIGGTGNTMEEGTIDPVGKQVLSNGATQEAAAQNQAAMERLKQFNGNPRNFATGASAGVSTAPMPAAPGAAGPNPQVPEAFRTAPTNAGAAPSAVPEAFRSASPVSGTGDISFAGQGNNGIPFESPKPAAPGTTTEGAPRTFSELGQTVHSTQSAGAAPAQAGAARPAMQAPIDYDAELRARDIAHGRTAAPAEPGGVAPAAEAPAAQTVRQRINGAFQQTVDRAKAMGDAALGRPTTGTTSAEAPTAAPEPVATKPTSLGGKVKSFGGTMVRGGAAVLAAPAIVDNAVNSGKGGGALHYEPSDEELKSPANSAARAGALNVGDFATGLANSLVAQPYNWVKSKTPFLKDSADLPNPQEAYRDAVTGYFSKQGGGSALGTVTRRDGQPQQQGGTSAGTQAVLSDAQSTLNGNVQRDPYVSPNVQPRNAAATQQGGQPQSAQAAPGSSFRAQTVPNDFGGTPTGPFGFTANQYKAMNSNARGWNANQAAQGDAPSGRGGFFQSSDADTSAARSRAAEAEAQMGDRAMAAASSGDRATAMRLAPASMREMVQAKLNGQGVHYLTPEERASNALLHEGHEVTREGNLATNKLAMWNAQQGAMEHGNKTVEEQLKLNPRSWKPSEDGKTNIPNVEGEQDMREAAAYARDGDPHSPTYGMSLPEIAAHRNTDRVKQIMGDLGVQRDIADTANKTGKGRFGVLGPGSRSPTISAFRPYGSHDIKGGGVTIPEAVHESLRSLWAGGGLELDNGSGQKQWLSVGDLKDHKNWDNMRPMIARQLQEADRRNAAKGITTHQMEDFLKVHGGQ